MSGWSTAGDILSLSVSTAAFPDEPGLAGFIGAKGDGSGSDNYSYKTCKALVKLSPLANQQPIFYTLVLHINQTFADFTFLATHHSRLSASTKLN